jgi:hypothetical protein
VHTNELEAAMAGMRAAEKLLKQHHAAIKPQPNTRQRMRPLEITIKKTGPTDICSRAHLPANLSPPAHCRTQSTTANEACEALRCRQAVKDLAFYVTDACPITIDIVD